MATRARRGGLALWHTHVCRAFLAVCLWFVASLPAASEEVVAARYAAPTDRYGHGILGDAIEWGALIVETDNGRSLRLDLPETHVFEDVAPRVIDVPGQAPVVMVVQTSIELGARMALYRETGLVAATPYIGRTHRWLAPIGAADLDGDGALEFAYVDRPHLAKTIRIWRFHRGDLKQVGELAGYTNHRIGEDNIAGGIRQCGNRREMIVTDRQWNDIFAIGWDGRSFSSKKIGPHEGRQSFARAMNCK